MRVRDRERTTKKEPSAGSYSRVYPLGPTFPAPQIYRCARVGEGNLQSAWLDQRVSAVLLSWPHKASRERQTDRDKEGK